ncbi:fungal-specific transcription factor domain-containing protein [Aspergillus californicus]
MPQAKTFTKRRNKPMACVSCRESKVKCDGAEPACSNCKNRNRDCCYQAVDKRKLPLRVAIELLTSRVDQLCRFIQQHGLQPPPMSQGKDVALGNVLEMLGLTEINSSLVQMSPSETKDIMKPPTNSLPAAVGASPVRGLEGAETQQYSQHLPDTKFMEALQPQNISTSPTSVDQRLNEDYQNMTEIPANNGQSIWDWQLGTDAYDMPFSPHTQGLFASSPPSRPLATAFGDVPELLEPMVADDDRTLVEDPSSPDDVEGLIDELSDRVGTLRVDPGGQTQFYGPTSTFNLADMLVTANSKAHHVAQNDALECLVRLGTNKVVPADLEEHLVNLYFSWQDPSFHVVDRKTYEEAKEKWYAMGSTPFYSESLRNAMCALGASFEARYHPSFVTFPKSLVDFFGDRAKALLEVELDSACVATVQAMVILSSLEVGSGRDARGWLYSGMAIRLAFNLALHIDMSSYISSRVITEADADIRRTVFWAAYTVDHQLGFHLGRPFRTNMEDVTVGKPNCNASKRMSGKWAPYVLPTPLYAESGVPDCMGAVCEEQVNLCEIMASCGYVLYGTSSISKAVLQQLNEKIVTSLLSWKARLPPVLRINLGDQITPYIPHILLLHMQYYQNMIYAHRPWMSKSHLQPQPPKGPGHGHAREMCIQSAIAIAKILVMYEARYTLRRIHTKAVAITSSAVLLLLFAAVTNYSASGQDDIAGHLSTCFRALDEFAISWPSAGRAKDLLLRLQRRWEIRTRSSRLNYRSEEANLATAKQSAVSHGIHGPTSQEYDLQSGEQHEPHGDINIDTDIDWMLMPEGHSPSENRAADLYSLISNPAVVHPESGSM